MNEFDYLAKAKDKMQDEKYNEVISLCDKALKINNKLPEAYSFRGNARYNLGEYDTAADDFSHAIEQEPDDADHYYDRSWSYCNMDKLEDAIVDINKAIEIKPKISYFYYDKGRFEYWADRYKDSVVTLTKGIELKPTENKYIFRGNSYTELGMFDLALADFNSAIEFAPDCTRAYFRRGILYKRMEQLEKAEKDFKKAIELNPEFDNAMIELGFIMIQMGKKGAMKHFNDAVKVNPSADNYYLRITARADILKREMAITNFASGKVVNDDSYIDSIFNEKQAQDDIKDLRKILASEPDDIYYLRFINSRYVYLGQDENALPICEKLIELDSENEDWYLEAAYRKFGTGKNKEAIEDFDTYLKMNNGVGDAQLYLTRGGANYQLGEFENALKDLSKGIVMDEESSVLYYCRGLTNYKLKHFIQSYKDFEAALKLNQNIESETDYEIPKLIKIFLNKKQNNDHPIGLCQMNIKE